MHKERRDEKTTVDGVAATGCLAGACCRGGWDVRAGAYAVLADGGQRLCFRQQLYGAGCERELLRHRRAWTRLVTGEMVGKRPRHQQGDAIRTVRLLSGIRGAALCRRILS